EVAVPVQELDGRAWLLAQGTRAQGLSIHPRMAEAHLLSHIMGKTDRAAPHDRTSAASVRCCPSAAETGAAPRGVASLPGGHASGILAPESSLSIKAFENSPCIVAQGPRRAPASAPEPAGTAARVGLRSAGCRPGSFGPVGHRGPAGSG